MNHRWFETPQTDLLHWEGTAFPDKRVSPVMPDTINPFPAGIDYSPAKKSHQRESPRRELGMTKDSLFIMKRDNAWHVVSEDYSYKTESYYTILQHELEGKPVRPSSEAVLDAYVVPICLERAFRAGIPVCEWGISQAYVPLPALLYGLNYFATSADFFVVNDTEQARNVIKHITNKGKYPFCYQKLGEGATIHTCTAIFGRTVQACHEIAGFAEKCYSLFSIPLVHMIFVKTGTEFALSSLAPIRYNHLTEEERKLLASYIGQQEFL